MEAMVQTMRSIMRDSFPCLPYVPWAYMKQMDFQQHTSESEGMAVAEVVWAIPKCNMDDFYKVAEDFCVAAFKFLEAIPEARMLVQSLQSSAPSVQSLQAVMAPDAYEANLAKFHGWLASGRCSVYEHLHDWDEMAMTISFWKDSDFVS